MVNYAIVAIFYLPLKLFNPDYAFELLLHVSV